MYRIATLRASAEAFLHRFGQMMGSIILAVIYVVLLGPVALLSRWLSDPLRLRPTGSGFVPWRERNDDLAAARRQG